MQGLGRQVHGRPFARLASDLARNSNKFEHIRENAWSVSQNIPNSVDCIGVALVRVAGDKPAEFESWEGHSSDIA